MRPERRQLALAHARQRSSERDHIAGGRHVEPRREMERCRLSRPGRAVQCDELAPLDAYVEPAERDRLRRSRPEDPEDIVELERSERQLVTLLGLAVEAPQRHRKLSIINR